MTATVANKTKAAIGALLAGSMLVTAMPAAAQYRGDRDRYHRDRDGISAGEVIAGAVVIGGLAAILSSNNGRYRDGYDGGRYDGRYNDGYDYRRYGNSRQAIEQCVYAVERRGGRRDDVDVRRITDVERIRGGYRIEGRAAVDYNGGYRGDARDRDHRWDRDDRTNNYRGGRGYGRDRYDDRGSFSCTVRNGRVQDVDFRGF
jgi:hypothetical protein